MLKPSAASPRPLLTAASQQRRLASDGQYGGDADLQHIDHIVRQPCNLQMQRVMEWHCCPHHSLGVARPRFSKEVVAAVQPGPDRALAWHGKPSPARPATPCLAPARPHSSPAGWLPVLLQLRPPPQARSPGGWGWVGGWGRTARVHAQHVSRQEWRLVGAVGWGAEQRPGAGREPAPRAPANSDKLPRDAARTK